MGQSNSTPVAVSEEESDESPSTSGVGLAKDLEKEIVQHFANSQLQTSWNSFQTSLLERHESQQQSHAKQLQQLQELRAQKQQQRQVQSAPLDARMEKARASFTDEATALQYTVDQLFKKYGDLTKDEQGRTPKLSCLGPRAHWMDCVQKYQNQDGDLRPCNAYLQTLEACVHQVIVTHPERYAHEQRQRQHYQQEAQKQQALHQQKLQQQKDLETYQWLAERGQVQAQQEESRKAMERERQNQRSSYFQWAHPPSKQPDHGRSTVPTPTPKSTPPPPPPSTPPRMQRPKEVTPIAKPDMTVVPPPPPEEKVTKWYAPSYKKPTEKNMSSSSSENISNVFDWITNAKATKKDENDTPKDSK